MSNVATGNLKLKTTVFLECIKQKMRNLANYSKAKNDFDTKEIVKALKKHGYFILNQYYDAEKCRSLCQEIEKVLATFPDTIEVDGEESDHRIWAIEKVSELAKEFHQDEYLMAIAKAYLKADMENFLTLGARLNYMPQNKGSGGGWHRDSAFFRQFKAIIYLSDVNKKNGPFQYVKASNSIKNVLNTIDMTTPPISRFENIDFENLGEDFPVKTLCGKAGDVILTDTQGIHRGKPIEAEKRYALTNYYVEKYRSEEFAGIFNKLIKLPQKI